MGCVASRTRVKHPPVPSALPSYGVDRVLGIAKAGDTVSFIYMLGSNTGQRREVEFISRTFNEGSAGFSGRTRSGKVVDYKVEACREMYLPEKEPTKRARLISLDSQGSDAS